MPKPFRRIRAFRGELLVEPSGTAPESMNVLNSEELRAYCGASTTKSTPIWDHFPQTVPVFDRSAHGEALVWACPLILNPYIAATIGSVVIPSTTKITLAVFGSLAEAS